MQNINLIKSNYYILKKQNKLLKIMNLLLIITLVIISYKFIVEPLVNIPAFSDKENELIIQLEEIPLEELELN